MLSVNIHMHNIEYNVNTLQTSSRFKHSMYAVNGSSISRSQSKHTHLGLLQRTKPHAARIIHDKNKWAVRVGPCAGVKLGCYVVYFISKQFRSKAHSDACRSRAPQNNTPALHYNPQMHDGQVFIERTAVVKLSHEAELSRAP